MFVNPAVCVGMRILKSGDYTHTTVSLCVCVGMGIPTPGDYTHTDANRYIYVGMEIVRLGRYSRTAANQADTTLKSTAWAGWRDGGRTP